MNKVSVIIPNYNYGRFLAEAIESVLAQTLPAHEIIVVDDGSTDESDAIIKSFGARVIYINQKNAGVGAARNRGVEESSGEFIAFLDADDYWAPEKLERQMLKLTDDRENGFVGSGIINVDADGTQIDTKLDGQEGYVAERLLMFRTTVPANTLLIRREAFESVGGFDIRREMHPSEDWDLCFRMSKRYKCGFVPEPLLFYRHHGKGGHTNIRRMERAMLLGFKKAYAEGAIVPKNEAYGNLYRVLAGSYFRAGDYGGFLRNAGKSLWNRPAGIGYFLAFPLRRLGIKRTPAAGTDTNG